MIRILHVVAEHSAREAIGRTIVESASRVPGEHHLLAARVHDGTDAFASVHEVGGSLSVFTLQRHAEVADAVAAVDPEVIHVHGGALAPFLGLGRAFAGRTVVYTIYAWPRLPRLADLRGSRWSELRRSNVLRPRVVATSVLGGRTLRAVLRRSTARPVLTPDPTVVHRLGDQAVPLPSGAEADARRARFCADAPVIVFAGRAETVRGIDTLVDALPSVLDAIPTARLRLLLLPTAELDAVLGTIEARGLGASVEVVTTPVADLADELARAQVGVWPFKFDYTTSPPAMALAEAMAVGLPVVSTPVACVRSIARDERNARLVPVGDPSALARALISVLDDEPTWDRLATGGLDTIARDHNWVEAARVTGSAYAEALELAA